MTDARVQIELATQDSPSLKDYPAQQLERSYQKARQKAAQQTGIALSVFPENCPYSLELVLDDSWLPEDGEAPPTRRKESRK